MDSADFMQGSKQLSSIRTILLNRHHAYQHIVLSLKQPTNFFQNVCLSTSKPLEAFLLGNHMVTYRVLYVIVLNACTELMDSCVSRFK